MSFRIETTTRAGFTVFTLSGRIEEQATAELSRLFDQQTDYGQIVLDLKDVSVVDREVVRFLVHCQANDVTIENCTPYIREWMKREED